MVNKGKVGAALRLDWLSWIVCGKSTFKTDWVEKRKPMKYAVKRRFSVGMEQAVSAIAFNQENVFDKRSTYVLLLSHVVGLFLVTQL